MSQPGWPSRTGVAPVSQPDELLSLLVRLRVVVRARLGVEPLRVLLPTKQDEEHPVCLQFPAGPGAVGPTQRRILRAVATMKQQNPTAEEIAEAAELPYESHLKKTLAAMRQEKLLGGKRGEAGYPITPAGLAALDAAGGIEDNLDS